MIFDAPTAFSAAMQIVAGKVPVATDQSSGEIAALWSREARALSLFSARNTCAECLQDFRKPLLDFISGKINEATCRQEMQLILDHYGYTPEKGFKEGEVPPADKGSLRDLSSDKRIKLMIETITRQAANTAFMQSGQDSVRLRKYPAWELRRIYIRRVPRGSGESPSDIGWPERWVRAGGRLVAGRMIARKDDPIWQNLGDSGIFPDGTDSSAPPYAFNSGYGIVEVSRAVCAELGMDVVNVAPSTPSLLGVLFQDHPERKTLADLKAKRQEILDALKEMEDAA